MPARRSPKALGQDGRRGRYDRSMSLAQRSPDRLAVSAGNRATVAARSIGNPQISGVAIQRNDSQGLKAVKARAADFKSKANSDPRELVERFAAKGRQRRKELDAVGGDADSGKPAILKLPKGSVKSKFKVDKGQATESKKATVLIVESVVINETGATVAQFENRFFIDGGSVGRMVAGNNYVTDVADELPDKLPIRMSEVVELQQAIATDWARHTFKRFTSTGLDALQSGGVVLPFTIVRTPAPGTPAGQALAWATRERGDEEGLLADIALGTPHGSTAYWICKSHHVGSDGLKITFDGTNPVFTIG